MIILSENFNMNAIKGDKILLKNISGGMI